MDVAGYSNVKVTKRPDDAITASLDIDIWDDKIYILFSGSSKGFGRFIDVYNKKSGEYIKSFNISDDKEAYSLEVSKGMFYILYYNRSNSEWTIKILSN